MVNWNPYLESISGKYAQWKVYTLTDVEGRQRDEAEPPLPNIMVEAIKPAKEEFTQKQEKTERLGVLEGLRKYARDHVLLVGRPGSGKSTALARLLLEEAEKCRGADEPHKVPVLVELRYYQTSVLDLIRSFFKQHGLLLDQAEIERLLFDNQLLLLVDGLNELPSEAARQDLSCFRRENATTPMIFTTRDLNVGGDLGIAKKLEMQSLTERQMRDFVKSYLPEQGDRLLQQLSDRLREFGQTPLLLMMLCSVFKNTGNVPSNLGLVFREFTKFYDRQRLQDVLLPDELRRRWWQPLLERLAWKMTQGCEPTELQVAISRQEAEEIFTEFLRQEGFDRPRDRAMAGLEDLLKHHLIQLGAEDKIESRHQLIQEYYTAESLLKQLPKLDNDKLKREYLNYLKWTEPLALMLDLEQQEEQALRVVKLALEVDFRLAARLAGAVKPEFQETTVALIAEIEIAQQVKVELLGLTRSGRAIALLQQVLNDEDSNVCSRAAEALGNIGNEVAVPALVQALNHADSSVRRSAAKALGNIGNEAAVPALVQALNHADSNVYSSAAEALGNIGNEAAVSALVQALNHADSSVRWRAAEALENIGNEAAVSALVQALNHADSNVYSSAAEALGNIGNEAAVSTLVQALNHADFLVGWSAAKALENIGNAAVPALVQALNHADSNVCSRAAKALGNIGNEAAVPALVQALNHADSSVRRSAAKALGNIGNEAAVPALVQALNHADSSVRRSAAEALENIGNEAAVSALVQALNHADSSVRRSAAEALGNIGNEAAVPALVQALNHADSNVYSSAAEALGNIGNEAAVPALVQALNHADSSVRWRAAEALENIGNEAAVSALVQALNHADSSVRWRAAEALENIASSKLLPDLFKLLQTTGENYLLNTISAIQERCKYYNYTLTQTAPLVQYSSVSVMHILHLSDLHFGTLDNARNWYSQIAEDLSQELDRPHLNALILSGDIANRSTPEEYAAAKEFLDKLCKEFDLNQEQVIIVPGNHDLNWEISDESYKPEKRKNYKGSMSESYIFDKGGDYIEVLDPEQYKRRFEHFSNFYKAVKGKEYPTDCDRQYTLERINNLLVLGLNSAWQLDHHYKSRASIKPEALSNAFEEIRRNPEYQNCQKIAVWHHPIDSASEDRIKESNFLERLAVNGFRIFLHGHVHQAQKGFYEYDAERGLYRICAGTFGAPTRELPTATAWQYHLLKFEGNKLTVRSRKRQSETGAWEADTCWRQGKGKASSDCYEIQLAE